MTNFYSIFTKLIY